MNVADEAGEMEDSDNESSNSFTDLIDTDMIDTDEADDVEDEIIDTEQHEEKETIKKVWRMIGYRSCMKKVDVLSSFKFFIKLHRALKHDRTLQMIMQGVQRVRDEYCMEFNEAVAYIVNKRKQLICDTVEKICGVDLDEESDIVDNEEENNTTDEDADDADNGDDSIDDEEGEDYYTDNDEIWKELYDDASVLNKDICCTFKKISNFRIFSESETNCMQRRKRLGTRRRIIVVKNSVNRCI